MSAVPPPPPLAPALLLPLPPNWSEHRAPNGQLYYHNSITQESTYIRPPPLPIPMHFAAQQMQSHQKKKEKPVEKIRIPGTEYIRVVTNEGRIFWNHVETKKSLWVMPEEIKEKVEEWEKAKKEEEEKTKLEEEKKANDEKVSEMEKEVERVKAEVEQEIALKNQNQGKRKAPLLAKEKGASKKARVEDEDADADKSEKGADDDDVAAQDEDSEQRSMLEENAEVLARDDHPTDAEDEDEAGGQVSKPTLTVAEESLSIPEAKALFRTLLDEKSINPLLPWDTSLPLIIRDSRYLLLPSLSLRKEVFDEWCRDTIREAKEAKVREEREKGEQGHIPEPGKQKYIAAYNALLRSEVKSTRMAFTDFKRQWRKDRRFWEFGRDERERQKRFKEWQKELGEIKRADAKKAEGNFYALLRERAVINPDSTWKEVKKPLVDDPRYDAVGSSSLREELYEAYVKTMARKSSEGVDTSATSKSLSKSARRERALQERESQIKSQKELISETIDRTRAGASREEGEAIFRSLLTDAVREPSATWDSELDHLSADPRFVNSPLHLNERVRLFHAHISNLRTKHLNNLHALFASHTPKLNDKFDVLPISSVRASLPAAKLKLSTSELEAEFSKWQRERSSSARKEFNDMLAENSFLEFWGRAGKSKIDPGADSRDGTAGMDVKVANEDLIGEEEGDEEARDVREMAKGIDIEEVERVLKNDKRYRIFDHIPEHRAQWLGDYMQSMAAPKLSVHTD